MLPLACLAIACVAGPRIRALEYVEAAAWHDGVLEVASARGIGGFTVEAAPQRPFTICFRYGGSRPYSRLEGLEVVAIGSDGVRRGVDAVVTGGCATVAAAPRATSLHVGFVDFHR
jgi:hypothetical protein